MRLPLSQRLSAPRVAGRLSVRANRAPLRTSTHVPSVLPVTDSGLRDCIHIESQEDFSRLGMPVRRLLHDELDVGASSNRFCPVQLDDGSVVVITVDAWRDSDQVDELERMIEQRRYRLAQPSRWVAPAPLLLALVRGQVAISSKPSGQNAHTEHQRSSLADAFNDMVAWGVEHGASDLHINVYSDKPHSDVKFTIDGRYVAPSRFANMPTTTLSEILAVAWMDVQGGNGAVFDPVIEQQGRIRMQAAGKPVMLRWASLATDAGPSVCLRILRFDARADIHLSELGYLPQQVATLDRARLTEGGAIVLAGVVGSGKSTTIATMMSMIPRHRKVITLEDPVEYLIEGALQNSVSRSLDDNDSDAFNAKLRTVKRSAMNDLLMGEIRDRETGRAFMDLVGSGSSVYTTVHAGSAMLIPDRLASDFIAVSRDFLATPGVLKLLVYQTLLPILCQHCALTSGDYIYAHGQARWQYYANAFQRLYNADVTSLRFRNVGGCNACQARQLPELYGYLGRTVVAEMIEPGIDDEFLRNLRAGDNIQQRRYMADKRRTAHEDADMTGKSAMECAVYKALQGQIDPQDIESRFKAFETVFLERR